MHITVQNTPAKVFDPSNPGRHPVISITSSSTTCGGSVRDYDTVGSWQSESGMNSARLAHRSMRGNSVAITKGDPRGHWKIHTGIEGRFGGSSVDVPV